MLPRNLDSSTPVASAELLFSLLPQLDHYTEWEPCLSAIGDVAYACELVLKSSYGEEVTYKYTVSLEEPINPTLQRIRVTKSMRVSPYVSGEREVQFSYKHNLTSAFTVFNPENIHTGLLAGRIFDCFKVVDNV